jgi:hypothetical protein
VVFFFAAFFGFLVFFGMVTGYLKRGCKQPRISASEPLFHCSADFAEMPEIVRLSHFEYVQCRHVDIKLHFLRHASHVAQVHGIDNASFAQFLKVLHDPMKRAIQQKQQPVNVHPFRAAKIWSSHISPLSQVICGQGLSVVTHGLPRSSYD